MSWKWIDAVLRQAQLPSGLHRAIKRLVELNSSLILVLDKFTCRRMHLASGLAQGCPLSCILYVIAVDPFLEYSSTRVPGVDLVVGFCDDWSFACISTAVLRNLQAEVEVFEQASGQRVNRAKTKVLPTLRVAQGLLEEARGQWLDCEVVSEAVVLGLALGYALNSADMFARVADISTTHERAAEISYVMGNAHRGTECLPPQSVVVHLQICFDTRLRTSQSRSFGFALHLHDCFLQPWGAQSFEALVWHTGKFAGSVACKCGIADRHGPEG